MCSLCFPELTQITLNVAFDLFLYHPLISVLCRGIELFQLERDQEMEMGGHTGKGEIKIIKMHCVHASRPHDECNHYIFQI